MDTSGEQEQRFTETRPARFIAVGNRINLSTASSEHSFSAELERIVNLAVPHLAQDRHNLVVLSDVLGLNLSLTGKRGYLSRFMHTSSVAVGMLPLSYLQHMIQYLRLYS